MFTIVGPDEKTYFVDVERGKLLNLGEINENGKVELSFGIANGETFKYEFEVKDGRFSFFFSFVLVSVLNFKIDVR